MGRGRALLPGEPGHQGAHRRQGAGGHDLQPTGHRGGAAGRPAQAERWYRREIELDEEIGNPKEVATDYNNLANLLLATYTGTDGVPRPDLATAEAYPRRALAIKETLELSSEPWKPTASWPRSPSAVGMRPRRGRGRREQETFAAFPGSWANLERQFGRVAAAAAAAAQGVPGTRGRRWRRRSTR